MDIQVEGSKLMKETDEKLKENLVQLYYTARARDYEPPKDSGERKKTWSGHWVNGKCKHTPCVIYSMKRHCKFRPEHDDVTHGINLKIQENEILEPNEFKKIDLGIKIFSNRCRPVHLTPKLTTCLKYSVQILTGLVDIGFSSYLQIGIFNCTNEIVRIPKGKEMCEIHCLEHPIKVIDEYESETIDHGGELEPNTLYIDRLWRFA
jgi:dUTPase